MKLDIFLKNIKFFLQKIYLNLYSIFMMLQNCYLDRHYSRTIPVGTFLTMNICVFTSILSLHVNNA